MITFIFFDLAIVGFLVLFLLSLLGTGVSSVFNVLPEYINIIALIIFIAQIIKLFIFIRYENFKIDKLTKIIIMIISLIVECFRCLILAIIICNWLASYSATGLFEVILTGVTFIFDVLIYGIIIVITESISFYQSVMISDSMLGYLIIGIINCVSLFVIVNLLTNGALMEAFKAWLPVV